ncbi:hypothetical protein P9775_005021 [Pseudomonas aeruginosa]|uniref:hypothetical protein n=1 Tax=Pseudomonas aeruginosa TaxID=287 RepID=UPI0005BCF639|nr:hypothetical protein [Pseudomonas aeruginosa]EKW0412586.1 hypothetical protein [Pseudomonas aeruginosa]EKW1421981.1 hypothetical protein [Pseudomonas aeruginosa]EKW1689951.1 hypothetical protein [Pseudomonas aeruginosa]MBP5962404.1 hypothetical protein [Pseudomonas aeruginosa]MDE5271603.1 hypothetical protein [Pseudomonas aeruginosa]
MSKITLHPEWRQAAKDLAAEFEYGDLITLEWLRNAFQLEEPRTIEEFKSHQLDFLSCMDALRQELLVEYQLSLKNIRGAGYELVNPNDQVVVAWHSAFGKVRRELGKLAGAIRYIRHDELTDEKRREHADAQAKLSGIHAFVAREGSRKLGQPTAAVKAVRSAEQGGDL